jgi:TolA-binding protein
MRAFFIRVLMVLAVATGLGGLASAQAADRLPRSRW